MIDRRPLTMEEVHKYSVTTRLVEKIEVDRSNPDGCWIWTGAIDHYGYGVFKLHGSSNRVIKAHNAVFTHEEGEIPAGFELDHLCLNKVCVRPSHLDIVTRSENIRRQWVHRKAAKAAELAEVA